MKKLLLAVTLLTLCSCRYDAPKVKPIEFYKNKGIIVINSGFSPLNMNDYMVRCKDTDSIFYITLTRYDLETIKEGDTIK